MENIAYHESFVRNSMVFCFQGRQQPDERFPRTSKDQVEGVNQSPLIDPKSDHSVSKVSQQTFVGMKHHCEGKFHSSHLE